MLRPSLHLVLDGFKLKQLLQLLLLLILLLLLLHDGRGSDDAPRGRPDPAGYAEVAAIGQLQQLVVIRGQDDGTIVAGGELARAAAAFRQFDLVIAWPADGLQLLLLLAFALLGGRFGLAPRGA